MNMNIGGITSNYPAGYEIKRTTKQTSVPGIFNNMIRESQPKQAAGQGSETKTEIIVKPDGSRVLVMTMSVGGMETTVSLEISKPTKAPNDNSRQDTDNHMPIVENDTVSDEMSDISNSD